MSATGAGAVADIPFYQVGGKVNALFQGRYNVAFSDVQAVVYPALRHRLILNFEGEAEGITADQAIKSVLEILSE